jgi:hypothetical protein
MARRIYFFTFQLCFSYTPEFLTDFSIHFYNAAAAGTAYLGLKLLPNEKALHKICSVPSSRFPLLTSAVEVRSSSDPSPRMLTSTGFLGLTGSEC